VGLDYTQLVDGRLTCVNAGSDDFQLRVYNYNTSEKVTSFEAHPDYIRAIAVHPTQPFVLTASVRDSPKDTERD
jgi:WD40 repeat protein